MRRAFIAFGLVVFLIYCWASVERQNRVAIPDYRLVEIDLLDGMARQVWESDSQARFQRLMALEAEKYQLPADARLPAPPPARAGAVISPDKPLASDDFEYLVSLAAGEGPVRIKLRDTSAIRRLLGRNYALRDVIDDPDSRDRRPLYQGGRLLDKDMLDRLRDRGVASLTVVGHASPVGFLPGTAIMVAVIFLTLAAALKPILWDPFAALLEKRLRELADGEEAERRNQAEAARFEEERGRRNALLRQEVRNVRLQGQREAARRAETILREAREKEKEVKTAGIREMDEASRQAGEELARQIPALALAIADALTPGRRGGRGAGE
ncbi:MAG: ATP synthase F0 subunit B [Planctomycetota bacterium]|nr:ATP synthase F0 subunit B [Planctomycetota bacterium]